MLRRRLLHDMTKVKVLLIQFRFFTSVLFYSKVSRPLIFIYPSPPFIVNEAIFFNYLYLLGPQVLSKTGPKVSLWSLGIWVVAAHWVYPQPVIQSSFKIYIFYVTISLSISVRVIANFSWAPVQSPTWPSQFGFLRFVRSHSKFFEVSA